MVIMIHKFLINLFFHVFLSEFLRRKFEAEKQQIILENTDEKSSYQRLLKEFNRLELKNEHLEAAMAKYKGGNAHKVRNNTFNIYFSLNQAWEYVYLNILFKLIICWPRISF